MEIILALDLGTKTGWAMIDKHTSITSGTECFKVNKFQSTGMVFLKFKRWLTELKNRYKHIDYVYFEAVRRHLGTDAAHMYGGFMAHLTAWCEHHDIPYQGVAVGTIKKHIAGKGNASKQEVINAVKLKGFKPIDDNEADALALLDFALTTYHREEL
ncbi:hypothetical protein N9N97_01545 [Rickettsiaceae bacterium]|nr:hypothetical protein [Rickettsiaceae bacterium]